MTSIASFPKNSREEVKISLDQFNGHDLVNIRVFYRTESGDTRPGKQGLAIKVELLPDLMAALEITKQALTAKVGAA